MDNTQFIQALDQYTDLLIEKKGLAGLPSDKKEELRDQIQETLISEFNKEVLRRLPEDKLEEFEKTVEDESKSTKDAGEIVESAGLDTGAILEEVVASFEEYFLKSPEKEEA
ncbi:hypothetical protein IJG79_00890 [Candidatus Saccharibacteria bacterium]|nr:hypothetical protein [Candidatus Saccharibacteria bacterium]